MLVEVVYGYEVVVYRMGEVWITIVARTRYSPPHISPHLIPPSPHSSYSSHLHMLQYYTLYQQFQHCIDVSVSTM